jgi:hypothetical protein
MCNNCSHLHDRGSDLDIAVHVFILSDESKIPDTCCGCEIEPLSFDINLSRNKRNNLFSF